MPAQLLPRREDRNRESRAVIKVHPRRVKSGKRARHTRLVTTVEFSGYDIALIDT